MPRLLRSCLLSLVLLFVVPAAAHAATVTVSGTTIRFNAASGETNTAVIAKQSQLGPDTYFVGDQSPGVTVTMSPDPMTTLTCKPTPPAGGLPKGFLCVVPGATSLVENLGDGNDTGVISAGSSPPTGTINGGDGNDTLVGGTEQDTFNGGAGTDTVAYVSIGAASINRTTGVTATLPTLGAPPTTTNGQTGENDSIASDVEGLVGTNFSDTLTGNDGPNTIAGTAPPGTPGVDAPTFTGTDTINGLGGDDTLATVGNGTANGGDGNDTLVGGSDRGTTTTLNGDAGNDNLVSGLGNDDVNGGAGTDFLVYASVKQVGITRGSEGVTAALADPGQTAKGGENGTSESDTVHDDIENLVGSGGNDTLTGNGADNTIAGAAPAGTPGVDPGPAGTDTINGLGGNDTLLAGDDGTVNGGEGNDTLVGGNGATTLNGDAGDDRLVSGTGNDTLSGGAGTDFAVYASVAQAGIRRTTGVTATLANPGTTTTNNGAKGSTESDTIDSTVENLVGSNGDDTLTGNDGPNTIVGAVPPGTAGADPGPPGNDTLNGAGGNDVLLGSTGNDTLNGGPGIDVLVAGAGNDTLTGDADIDTFDAGAGDDRILARDGNPETITCGAGVDTVTADPTDRPAADCENVDTGAQPPATVPPPADKTPPRLSERPGTLLLRSGRRVALFLACRNEAKGCRVTFVLQTANRVRVGRARARRYTLARVTVVIRNGRARRIVVRLARITPKLVRRHHNLALRAVVRARDTSGNRAQKVFRLRLHRP